MFVSFTSIVHILQNIESKIVEIEGSVTNLAGTWPNEKE